MIIRSKNLSIPKGIMQEIAFPKGEIDSPKREKSFAIIGCCFLSYLLEDYLTF